jgi:chromosome segregation ATPase
MGKEKIKLESTIKELKQDNKELRMKVNSLNKGEDVNEEQDTEAIEELKNKLNDKEAIILSLEHKVQKLEGEIKRQKQETEIIYSQRDSSAMLNQVQDLRKELLEAKEGQLQKTKLDSKTKELIRSNEAYKAEIKELKNLLEKSAAKAKDLEQKGESVITDKEYKESLIKIKAEKKKFKDDVINKEKTLRQAKGEIDSLKVKFIIKL